jgi:hypothetical protein
MNHRYGGLYTRLHGPLPTDTNKFGPQAQLSGRRSTSPAPGRRRTGCQRRRPRRAGYHHPTGAVPAGSSASASRSAAPGQAWNNGYQWDLGEALDKRRMYHQPIGYNTNPFPMKKGVD